MRYDNEFQIQTIKDWLESGLTIHAFKEQNKNLPSLSTLYRWEREIEIEEPKKKDESTLIQPVRILPRINKHRVLPWF